MCGGGGGGRTHAWPTLSHLSNRNQLQAIAYHHLLCDPIWGQKQPAPSHTPHVVASQQQAALLVCIATQWRHQYQAPEIRACCVNNASMQPSQLSA